MRKNVIIVGVIVLVIGASMFFGSSYVFKSGINLSQLIPLKNSIILNPGLAVEFVTVPPGKIMASVYNDSLAKPINFTTTSGTVSVQNENSTFIVEYYNSGNNNQTVEILNNYTVPMTVNYSTLVFSASGILYSIIMVLVGGIMMFIGGIIAVIGLILKPKRSNIT